MSRFNTGNNIPSISEEDFYDNSMALDEAMNSTDPTWRDRFNVEKPTIDAALKSAGFMPAAFDFVTGGTLQPGDRNKAVYNPAPNGDNNWYRWNGVFPKEIAANSQPNPKDENNWVLAHFRIGIVEKEALRRTYLEAGYNLVNGSFEQGGTLVNSNDVLLQERTGKVFTGPAGIVAAGTNPASGGFVDVSPFVLKTEPPLIAKTGSFSSGGRAESMKSALLSSDGYYYTPRTGVITAAPGSSPNSMWVCVGLLNGAPIDDMLNWLDGRPHLNAFIAARDSKSIRGGGVVTFPAGDYTFADEFVCVDYVKFVGEDRSKCRIFGAAGSGAGKAVVRACKSPVGSADIPEYLSYSGFSNCTINGNATWDVGLYVRHCTNESVFDNVTAQNCKKANSIFIGVFYVSAKNHVSRDARDLGAVIGKKIFSEGGLREVNASAFNNLRGNYAGLDDAYDPTTNPYAGACITIWTANSCAFDYVGAENAYGAGAIIRKGINSTIPNLYVESNGKGTAAVDKIGARIIAADFPSLIIGSLFATRQQKIYLEGSSLLQVGEIYSESFANGIFMGTGKVLLMNGHSANNYIGADQAFINNIETKRIAQFGNVPFTNFASLDSTAVIFGEAMTNVQVVMVPRVTLTTADPIVIGLSNSLSGGQVLEFGTSFTAGVPITKTFSKVSKGAGRLTHRSNYLPSTTTNFAMDVFIIQYVCDYQAIYNKWF
ncbi:hypothetical protein PS1_0168 [Aeromonas phage PS1]|uniref:Tail spike TSP1/Gp66 N-terminal domain-containing protein n=1 Tax=Aeromonas phage PS1 TaxID=2591406 RepID=A0A514TUI2_9CAUD|nr:tail spike protein [Aeromonas phage PS1]QDJ96679.1 hypothetical protein PS1_0168 [Aeromonas phage PS1]